nr:TMV resistance protein N-like [Ipomoea batatas]
MLLLSGCLKLTNFPDITGRMACLLEVHAEATALRLPDDLGEMECLEELYCDNTVIQEPPPSISLLKKLKILTFRGCKPLASRSQYSFFLPRLLPGTTCQDTKASPSLSLSGLSSLIQLDLSDCSMLDGGFPSDLGELPCLQVLNLSNNKFVGIPAESLARLTRLKKLDLVACSKLETLPELPSSIQQLYIDECTDLKGNIDMFAKYPKLSRISFTKCLQLLQDQRYSHMVDGIWQLLLKGLSKADRNFSILFPGISIPECFTYKNLGRSIAADLPRNWYNDKFLGFAICVPDFRGFKGLWLHDYVSEKYAVCVVFGYRTHDGGGYCALRPIGVGTIQNVVSERSCLAYLSYRCLSSTSRDYQNPNEWSQIVVYGSSEKERTAVYGLQLVYEDDVKQAQAQADEQLMIQSNYSILSSD